LLPDAGRGVVVARVGSVVFRLDAKECKVEIEVDWMARDAQVLKAGAQKGDGGHVTLHGVLRDDLADDSVGGEDFQYIQAFDHGGCDRRPALAWLRTAISRYMRVSRAKGYH